METRQRRSDTATGNTCGHRKLQQAETALPWSRESRCRPGLWPREGEGRHFCSVEASWRVAPCHGVHRQPTIASKTKS